MSLPSVVTRSHTNDDLPTCSRAAGLHVLPVSLLSHCDWNPLPILNYLKFTWNQGPACNFHSLAMLGKELPREPAVEHLRLLPASHRCAALSSLPISPQRDSADRVSIFPLFIPQLLLACPPPRPPTAALSMLWPVRRGRL